MDNYYSATDGLSNTYYFDALAPAEYDEKGEPVIQDESLNFTPQEIGTTTIPMENAVKSLKARIRQGVGRIEFSFLGQGKGSAQQSTPESYGKRDRRDIRELLEVTGIKTSTHAGVHTNSLAGFDPREGNFNAAEQARIQKEIRKAIDFAGDATKGGAIVFHFHEWNRPLSDIKSRNGAKFRKFDEESIKSPLFTVDDENGRMLMAINKETKLYRPKYKTVKDIEEETGEKLVGTKDENGRIRQPDDWVDFDNNAIRKTDRPEQLFLRVPVFRPESSDFETEEYDWDKLVEETEKYNKNLKSEDEKLTPQELYTKIQLENNILQAKGGSLYHAKYYEMNKRNLDKIRRKIKAYNTLKENLPEERKWEADLILGVDKDELEPGRKPIDVLKDKEKIALNELKYVHESSASSDVRAREMEERWKRVTSVEKYGLKRTAQTVANAAMYAMEVSQKRKDNLEEDLYIAPENFDPNMYGSHPDEYRAAIERSREAFAKMLEDRKNYQPEDAQNLAKKYIKGTLDIGHLNTLRQYYVPKEGTPPDQVDEEFNKWMLDEAEKLVEEGYVGHIHLSDNFGFDDEHLSPGEGNIPMNEFLKRMKKHGVDDIIVEEGSFNSGAGVSDTLRLINSPVYGVGRRTRFRNVHEAHFGYQAPGFFIAGSYVPSNDWKLWSDVPLE